MKIITLASLKGGVGKTTDAVFLGQAYSSLGKRVLVADLDPNNNLTDYYLRNISVDEISARNIKHVFLGRIELKDAVYQTSFGPDCIPATPKLASINSELNNDFGAVLLFDKMLKESGYDIIILDTPPADCFELRAGVFVSDLVVCPISYSRWTIHGYEILEDMVSTNRKTGRKIDLICLPSNVSPKKSEGLLEITDQIPVLQTHITRNDGLENAVTLGAKLKVTSNAWSQFLDLAHEVA
ncbi:ParA family protein [Leptospira andrefontaineae]|uniref:ParA family protein n=1 Tax=Leptospira andrefontaineae TaxID=2484976 RepID=A0A4R9GY44_9LEPT|nr:ParA family protein [Leptospira andrefontaineae]TGK36258.1 ParA family protein [Leptospira andrefontaineae]